MKILGEYTSGGDKMQMCYAFDFLASTPPTAARAAEILALVDAVAAEGWVCWAFSNHDVVRHVTRWGLTPAAARAYTTLMMCLRGSVCLYQGEELGLPEANLRFEDLRDPYGIRFWPEFKGRDGARTPMVWKHDTLNAGFSSGLPWLPITSDHMGLAVDAQEQAPEALLHHYRRAIAFRHAHPLLRQGTLDDLRVDGTVLSFQRSWQGDTMFCAFNLSHEPATIAPPAGNWLRIASELNSSGPGEDGQVHLGPWQPCLTLKR
jgi:alpha-glucosidase